LLLAVLAILYGGYWFFGRAGIEQAARDMLDRPGISYDSLSTIGFPSRFDTTIENIDLQAAGGRIGWEAPFFQLFMLSYSPHKVIAVWPDRQSLRIDDTEIGITSERMRASAQVGVATSVPLRQATLEAEAVDLSVAGASVSIARVLLAIRQASGEDNRYDAFAELTGLDATTETVAPEAPSAIRIDAVVTLDEAIDRDMVGLPPRRIEFRDATLRWTGLTLTGRGETTWDTAGRITSLMEIDVSDPERLVRLLEGLGLVGPESGNTLSRALAAIAGQDGSVTVPVSLEGRSLRVAGIPVDLP
jgi:hypothetical protein